VTAAGVNAERGGLHSLGGPVSCGAVEGLAQAAFGFVTLLLFPLLGILGLLKKRAKPYLAGALAVWILLGAGSLASGWTFRLGRERFLRQWLVGVALLAAFLAVAWLKHKRKISRWLRLAMVAITVMVFAKALVEFLSSYA